MIYPQSLRVDGATGLLEIAWDDHTVQRLDIVMIRRRCPCADCKSLRQYPSAELPIVEHTTIKEILPVGAYAAQFIFSDGHDRGIFPWTYLRGLHCRT